MKKHLFLVFALALMVPWAMQAQTPNATLPYSTGFEAGDDAGWTLINGSVTNKWYIDAAVHNTGSRALYISNDNGATNDYTITSTSVCFAVRTFTFTSAANPYVISFDWKSGGETTYDYLRCFLVPNDVTLTAGSTLPTGVTSTGTPTGWIDLGGKMNLSTGNWMNTTVEFNIAEAGDYKLVFMWRNDGSGGTQPAVAVDNVSLAAVSCPTPTVSLAARTSTSAVVNFSGTASTYLVSTDGELWEVVNDTTATLTDLTPQTNYTVRVRAFCGDGDTSFAGTVNFMTPCVAVPTDSLPYVYGFEDASGSGASASYNPCWGRHVVGTTSAYPYPSTTYKHSGTYSLYYYSSGTIWSWSTLPQFEEPINNLQLTFWLYKSSANYGHVYVGVMTDPNDLSTFDTIAHVQPSATSTWEYFEVPLMGYTGNGTFITLLAASSSLSYSYIDDITVDLPPTCPRVSDIAVENATSTSVDLTWHSNASSATEYVVEYGLHGFTLGTGTVLTVSDTTATLAGLTMGMPYDVYVTTICNDDTSTIAISSFTAGCAAITSDDLPFTDNFEAYGTGAAYPINACWAKGSNASTAWPYPTSTAAIGGIRGLYFYGNTSTSAAYHSWAALPPVDENLSMSNLMVRFNAKRYSTASATNKSLIYVGIADSISGFGTLAGINDATVWIDTIDLSGEAASSIHEIEVSFENYTGNGRYVVFFAPSPAISGTSTTYNYFSVDDVTLTTLPSCFRPLAVQIEGLGTDEATLSWVSDPRTANPSNWDIEYGPRGFTPGEGTVASASDTTVTLTGLSLNTWYDAYISANCAGEASESRMITFVTNSLPAEMPYATGFEATQDSDWVFYNETFPNHWMIGQGLDSNAAATGTGALYITNNNINNAYTIASAQSTVFAFRLFDFDEAGEYAISFDWHAYGESTFDYLRAFLVPNNIIITPGDMNGIAPAVTPEGWINLGSYNNAVKLNLSSSWQTNATTVIIPDSATGLYKLVFFWRNDGSGGTQPPASVDNVVVRQLSCFTPQNLAVTSVGAYEADLSWQGNASNYQMQYATSADFSTGVTSVIVSDTSATVTGLTEYTQYYFRVRGICDEGDTSFWSTTIAVHTTLDCGPNGLNILDTIGNGTSSSYTYTFYAYSTYPRSITASIYTAEELNNMGLQQNNRIHSISLHTGTTGGTIRQAKIYMKEVTLDGYGTSVANDTVDRTTMTLVYSGDITFTASRWNEIVLDSDFVYSGNNNLMVMFAHDTNSTASVSFYYTSTSPDYRNAYSYVSSTSTTFGTVTRTYSRTDIAFNICTEVPPCLRPTNLAVTGYSDTTATLTWNASSPAYEVMVSTTSVNPDSLGSATVSTYSATASPFTVTGLAPNTTYYWYVRSLCSASEVSEWSFEGTLTTACAPVSLPYTENFESYGSGSTATLSPCWRKGTNSSTAYPYPYSSNPINGTRSLYMAAYHASTATASYYSYAALPMFNAPVDTLALSFTTRRYNSTSTYYTTRLVVGVMDDPDNIATFTPVDTFDIYNDAPNTVRRFEVLFNNYTGNGKYIALYDEMPPLNGSNTYAYSYVYLDDVEVDYIPSCARVTNISVNNISRTGATVHWDGDENATSYDIEYGPEGFAHGTGTTVTSTTDSVNLTGLTASTVYDVYVRAHCSATDVSPWSFTYTFASECAPVALPLFYTMDNTLAGSSAPLPLCWTRSNNSAGNYNYYPYIYSTTYSHSGGQSLYFYVSTSTASYPTQEIMAFPEIDTLLTPINAVEVNFWARVASYPGRHLILGVMTDPTDMTTFTGVDTVALTATMTEYNLNTNGYTGYGDFVALRVDQDTTVSFSVYVDDLFIGPMSPCPRVYDLEAENATSTSVELSWTDTIGSTQWVIEYGVLGSETTTTVNATSNPYTLTGLTGGTNYRFRVAPICSNGMQADWSLQWHNFGTALNPATVPYSYDFENAAEWNNWQINSNGTAIWYRGIAAAGNATNVMYISTDGGATNSWIPATIVNSFAYRDLDFGADTHSYALKFRYSGGGCVEGNYDGISVLLVDPAVMVENANTALYSPWGNITTVYARYDTTWDEYTVLFEGISGVKRLVFDFFQSSTSTTRTYWNVPPAIDSIVVEQQLCERPYDLTYLGGTTTSATIGWTGDAMANYEVAYRPASSTGAFTIAAVTGNTYTINGLATATAYNVRVRKLCTDSLFSYWSSTLLVKTLCGVVSVADTLFEDFESYPAVSYSSNDGVLPTCWEGYNVGNTHIPHVTDSGTYSYCNSGRQAITFTSGTTTSYTGGVDNYVRLVDIAEPTNTLTIAYWMCTESSTNGFLEVGYLTGANYETDFVALKHIAASSATVHSGNGHQSGHGIFDTVSFDSVPAGNYPICFRWNYTSSYYSCCIDDIAVWSSAPACTAPAVTVTDTGETTVTLNWTGSAANYEVAAMAGTWAEPTTVTPVTGLTATLSGLTPATQYAIGVRAVCGEGVYSEWNVVSITTAEHPCYAPTNVAATNITLSGATIAWTPAEEGQTDFEIRYSTAGDTTVVGVTENPYTLTGLLNATEYSVAVRAICGEGNYSDWSAPATFTTASCQMVQGVNVPTATITTSSAVVNWTANGSSSYEVGYGPLGTTTDNCTRRTTTTNSYTITGLEEGTNYVVYVRSICGDGIYSDWTAGFDFMTTEVGIDDVDNNAISLYPNPASSTVTLTGIEGEATVTVVDMNGRVVKVIGYGLEVIDNSLTIDISELAQGAYFVRITGERVNAIRKLIVR